MFAAFTSRLFGDRVPPNPLDLQPGQKVRLKSGGPEMTVIYVTISGQIICRWFNDHALRTGRFWPTSIDKY
jgi:uncharacterized protein YodC (DUF2158 family)